MKKKLLYTSAVLFMLWAIGFFMLGFSSAIHAALWIAILVLIRSVLVCNTVVEKNNNL